MTSLDEPLLDDSMRRRIRRSAVSIERHEPPRVSEFEIARIARAVAVAHAKERRNRLARTVALSSVGFAAAAATFVYMVPRESAPAVAAAPRCESMSVAAANGALTAGERFSLDSRARIALGPDSVASFSTTDACSTTIALERGTVDVWAKDLAGGELRVVSGDVSVLVHGTVFRVTRDDRGTSVAVDEGLVEVTPRASGSTFLRPGQAVDVVGNTARRRELDSAERARVHAVRVDQVASAEPRITNDAQRVADELVEAGVALPAEPTTTQQVAASPVTAAELLARAEAAYRSGEVDEARRLFRTAGGLRGGDAEAAWLRLGRLEARAGRNDEAASALAEHRRRFPRGRLAAEALYLEARARRSLGDSTLAASLEERLLVDHPNSAQAARVRTMRAVEP